VTLPAATAPKPTRPSRSLTVLFAASLATCMGLVGCEKPSEKPETFAVPPWEWPADMHAFESAGKAPDVSPALLAAIAQISTGGQPNQAEAGCETARTIGVMGLLASGESGATLHAAAAAANLDPELVKTDEAANIAAAAAWLRSIAGPGAKSDQPADWYSAVAQWPGSSGPAAQAFAASVFSEMAGVVQRTRAGDPNTPIGDEGYIDPALLDVQGAGKPSPDQPGASYVPACASNYTSKSRSKSAIDRIIIHTVQGSAMGAVNWFANCSSNVSAHYTVSKYGGITQSVRDRDVAWHAGHYYTNQRSIGIEHEGFVAKKSTWTEAMLNASAHLTADLCQRYGIPIDRTHIIGHNEVPGCKHAGGGGKGCHHDPGVHFPWSAFIAKVKAAAGQATAEPPKPAPTPAPPSSKPPSSKPTGSKPTGPTGQGAGHCKPGVVWGAKGPIYRDVPTSLFAAKYVHALHGAGVVTGCAVDPPMFCPWCTISRSELIAWIARAMKLTPLNPTAGSFSDVPHTDPNARWIEAARKAGIVAGCGGGKLCAKALMKRGEVAAVIAKAAGLPVGPFKGSYVDVAASHPHAKAIESLAPACVAVGCGAASFCPNTPVKRSEAAFTIARAFHIGGTNPCSKPAAPKPKPAPNPAPKPDPKPDPTPNPQPKPNPKPLPSVTIISPSNGATTPNPVAFKFAAKNVAKIRLFSDGWALTPALPPSSLGKHTYSFHDTGTRAIRLIGLDVNGATIASHDIQIVVPAVKKAPPKVPDVAILAPKHAAKVANPVTFIVEGKHVAKVRLTAGGWPLGDAFNPVAKTKHTYKFNSIGWRSVKLSGYDSGGTLVASHDIKIEVLASGSSSGGSSSGGSSSGGSSSGGSSSGGSSSGGSSSGGSSSGAGKSGLPATAGAWGYILKVDHGIRSDSAGGGHFGASRYGNAGGHSGIDFLAPSATPLYAPCSGKVIAGSAGGYGNYVQLVCKLPDALGGKDGLYASMLYAHLATRSVVTGAKVVKGQKVGTVGKTGNASGSAVMPHVHFEVAIHASQSAGLNEYHASSNHSGNWAATKVKAVIAASCWTPTGLGPKTGPTFKGRRIDPFLLLSCAAKKPGYSLPGSWLSKSSQRWSKHFKAATFSVDSGK